MKDILKKRHVVIGSCVVVAGALGVGMIASVGRPAPTVGRNLSPSHASISAELVSSVSDALAAVQGDISYIHRTVVGHNGSLVVDSSTWVAPNGSSRIESFSPRGSPEKDEAISSKGTAQVIDYPLKEWWTLSSSPVIGSFNVQQVMSTVQSGVLAPDGHQLLNGTEDLVLKGTPSQMGTHNDTVTLLVNPTTDLPVSLTAVEGHGITVEDQLSWLPATIPANMAQLSTSVPAGFTHLSTPPTGLTVGGVG